MRNKEALRRGPGLRMEQDRTEPGRTAPDRTEPGRATPDRAAPDRMERDRNSTGQNIAAGNNGTATSARDNTASVPEERIIQEQSFPVELDGWGRVEFASCEPDHSVNFDDVSFFLVKDGQILYRFPYYCEGNDTSGYIGLFDSVEAVGFRDMNRGGKDDIVIIINYITGAGPQGMIPVPQPEYSWRGKRNFFWRRI